MKIKLNEGDYEIRYLHTIISTSFTSFNSIVISVLSNIERSYRLDISLMAASKCNLV